MQVVPIAVSHFSGSVDWIDRQRFLLHQKQRADRADQDHGDASDRQRDRRAQPVEPDAIEGWTDAAADEEREGVERHRGGSITVTAMSITGNVVATIVSRIAVTAIANVRQRTRFGIRTERVRPTSEGRRLQEPGTWALLPTSAPWIKSVPVCCDAIGR